MPLPDIFNEISHNGEEGVKKARGLFKEFKTFAMRGNVIDLAVGVIIGTAFGKIVSSLVADVIMPPIGVLLGGVNFASIKITLRDAVEAVGAQAAKPAVTLNIGLFIQTIIDFTIIAAAIFIVVRLVNTLQRKQAAAEAAAAAAAPPPEPPDDVKLLTEIRDLLKNDKVGT